MGDKPASGTSRRSAPRAGEAHRQVPSASRPVRSRVRDVMTTDVVTVDQITPFKQIAWLLVEHTSAPCRCCSLGRHVAGVVSEADLIAARDKHAGQRKRWTGTPRYGTDHSRYPGSPARS